MPYIPMTKVRGFTASFGNVHSELPAPGDLYTNTVPGVVVHEVVDGEEKLLVLFVFVFIVLPAYPRHRDAVALVVREGDVHGRPGVSIGFLRRDISCFVVIVPPQEIQEISYKYFRLLVLRGEVKQVFSQYF